MRWTRAAPASMSTSATPLAVSTSGITNPLARHDWRTSQGTRLPQLRNLLGGVAKLLENRCSVLTKSRHGIHARFRLFPRTRWKKRGHHPGGCVHFAPAFARLELRMPPDSVHVVHLRVGDLRLIEPLDDLFCGKCCKGLEDDRAQLGARGAALGI